MAKQPERAEDLLDRAADRSVYHAHVCLARARLRSELGAEAAAEAERWLLEGLEAATTRGHLLLQLYISTDLARLAPRTGKLRKAHDRLAACYARLTEGFERGRAREAKAALGELAARLAAGMPGA